MIRTLISLNEKDKRWLDSYSRSRHQSIAETVRPAVHIYRERSDIDEESDLFHLTAGF
ncbi:MAG: hypothetical protein KAH21_04720 [Spirochaetaceae bacterium]|nr:hypothetical protein [Spirochaetaceae bacterium]